MMQRGADIGRRSALTRVTYRLLGIALLVFAMHHCQPFPFHTPFRRLFCKRAFNYRPL